MEKFANLRIQSNDSKVNNTKSQQESEDDPDEYEEFEVTNKENRESSVVRGTTFKDLNIFVEIFNNGINQSDCVIPILIENGATLINPLWVHDCTTKNSLLKPETYQIKKTYTELLLDNRKRKYNDVVLNTTKSMETPGKRKKLKANSGKSVISPFFPNKENVVKSENVLVKSSFKSGTSNASNNGSDKISVPREKRENIPDPKSSVFGNNLRCFRELDNHPNNFLDKLSKQPLTRNVFQTSIKLRPKFPTIFTPLHENRSKTINKDRGHKESNSISEESLKQDDKPTQHRTVTKAISNPKSSENKKSNKDDDDKIAKDPHRTQTKFNSNSTVTKSLKRVNSEVLDVKNEKLLAGASKVLSKAHSKSYFPTQTNSTSTKSEVRKLLVINSPDSQELKNSEKIVMESINKAIHEGHFQESLNKKKQEATVRFSSIGLNDLCKAKIKSTIKELPANTGVNNITSPNSTGEVFTYTGENYSDLEESEFIVIKNSTTFNYFKEIKTLYVGLLNSHKIPGKNLERKFLRYNYFIDSEKKKKFLTFDSYLVKFPSIDFEAVEQLRLEDKLPFKGYKLFLHPESVASLNEADEVKQEVMTKIVSLLGGKVVNHIRLSDLCIINRVDSSQYFPPHVRNLNTDLIYDTLATLKLPDLDSFKYKPKDGKNKKNRK